MLRTLLLASAGTIAASAIAQPPTDRQIPPVEVDQNEPPDAYSSDAPDRMPAMDPVTQAEMRRHAQAEAPMIHDMPRDPMLMAMGGPLNIESNWDRFDEGAKGYLTPLEFGEWVMETNGQNMAAEIDKTRRSRAAGSASVQVLNDTAGALSQVDANHDWRVSREELASIAE